MADLAALQAALVAAVRANPGRRASAYADAIGFHLHRRYTHLRLAIARARAAGQIAPSDPARYGLLFPGETP